MAIPLFDLVMFSMLFGGAVYYRKRPSAHKSLMLLTAINFRSARHRPHSDRGPAESRAAVVLRLSHGPGSGLPRDRLAAARGPQPGLPRGRRAADRLVSHQAGPDGHRGWMQFAQWLTSFV